MPRNRHPVQSGHAGGLCAAPSTNRDAIRLGVKDARPRAESVTGVLTAAKTISGTPTPESPFGARMETAMTRTLVLALLFATLANALCLVGRF
jgi:hypothetical protein